MFQNELLDNDGGEENILWHPIIKRETFRLLYTVGLPMGKM